jgi:signal transduction histidine kinase
MGRLVPGGVAARLAVAFVGVAVVAMATVGIVGGLVAPRLFHRHLHKALPRVTTDVLVHADEAFGRAFLLALCVAFVVSLFCSAVAGAVLARRLARSVMPFAAAAEDVAAGRYPVHVPAPSLGRELDDVAAAFNDMAERLQRTEDMRRRLVADLAHELRTPVATLAAYLEGLQDGVTTLDADTRTVLQTEVSRLARLAEDASALSRAEEGRITLVRERVDPAELVSSAAKAAAERFTRTGVDLRTDLPAGLPALWADPDRLGQVLGNVLDNALRHSRPGGVVVVAGRAGQDDTIVLTVTDTGTGIAAADLPHVFERFYRAGTARDRATGGLGIGLTITRALVESHGGRITAASDGPGRGATFTIVLPLAWS